MNIKLFTKANCPLCVQAKQLLESKGLKYAEANADFPEIRQSLMEAHPSIRQMPAIFINGQHVGGFAGLQAALQQMGM
jgi:glutaredoxin 3